MTFPIWTIEDHDWHGDDSKNYWHATSEGQDSIEIACTHRRLLEHILRLLDEYPLLEEHMG